MSDDKAMHHYNLAQELFDLRKFVWQEDRFAPSGDRLRMTPHEWEKIQAVLLFKNRKGDVHHGTGKDYGIHTAELYAPAKVCPNGAELLRLEVTRFMQPVRQFAAGDTHGSQDESAIDYEVMGSFARMMRLLTVMTLTGLSMHRAQELFIPWHGNLAVLTGLRLRPEIPSRCESAMDLMRAKLVRRAHHGLLETVTNAMLGNAAFSMHSAGFGTNLFLRDRLEDIMFMAADEPDAAVDRTAKAFEDCIEAFIEAVLMQTTHMAALLRNEPLAGSKVKMAVGERTSGEHVLMQLWNAVGLMRMLIGQTASGDCVDLYDQTVYGEGSIGMRFAMNLANAAMYDGMPACVGGYEAYRTMLQYPWPKRD